MNETAKLSELLIDSFFECFNRGELSDLNFETECKSADCFSCVRAFMDSDYSCVSADLSSNNNLLNLQVVTWVLEKFNKYLTSVGTQVLSAKLSQFDEDVSGDYFLRVTDRVSSNNQLEIDWFKLIWDSAFNRVSCYEKSISYAFALHNESVQNLASNYDTLQESIATASTSVNDLLGKVNGKDGQEGLIQKVNDIRETIPNTTVTILGIFAAIVLAFSGAFSFSSSIMQNINGASIYRLVGVIVLLGIVCFNLIFCLIIYLLKGSKISKDAFSIIRFYFPLLLTDIILLTILGLTIAAWYFGWLEQAPTQDLKSNPSISCVDDVVQSDVQITNTFSSS